MQAHTRHTCKHYRLFHVCSNTLPQLKDHKHQLYCLIFHNILLNETAARSTFSNPSNNTFESSFRYISLVLEHHNDTDDTNMQAQQK